MNFKNLFNTEDDSDMIDMSNPDNHPDWAKEVHSKYGIGANRSPSSLPQYVHPEDIKSGEDMSSVYKSVFGNRPLKNTDEQEESPEIERVKDTIKSYREQGINDGLQLVPLYNKLVELRQAKTQANTEPKSESKPEPTPVVSPSVAENTSPKPVRSSYSYDGGLFNADEIGEMAAVPKRKKVLPMENEINAVKAEIQALKDRGLNDGVQLVPLYTKMGNLMQVQKALLDVEQQKLDAENRKQFPAFYGEEPAKAEVPLKSLSSKPRAQQSVTEEPLPSSTEQSASSADFDLESYLKSGKMSSSMNEDPLSFLRQRYGDESKSTFNLDSYLNPSDNSSPTAQDPLAFLNEIKRSKPSVVASAPSIPSTQPVAPSASIPSGSPKQSTPTGTEEPSLEDQLKSRIDLEKRDSENLRQRLEDAQNTANKLRTLDAFMKGINQLGAGISGAISQTKVDVPKIDDTLKDAADKYMEDFKARLEQEKEDPSSEYSKGFRDFAQPLVKQLKMDPKIIEGLSGKQLGAIIPELRQMYENKVTSEYRQQALAESRADRAQRSADAKKDRESLINQRTFATLPTRLENIGGPAGTKLRTRIQQAGNIYGTLGINPSDLDKMSDKQIEKRLDENKKLQAVEAAIELNSMLSGSAAPSQKTLEKLLLDSGYQRGMSGLEFLSNEQFARNQGKYLKDIIKITSRAEKYALDNLRNMEIRALSGLRRLSKDEVVGPDFVNFINQRGIDLKDLDAVEKKSLSEDEEAINWAKQNPKDPRAAEILKLQGQ